MLDLCRDRHRRIVLGTLVAEQRSTTLNDLTRTVLKHNRHVLPAEEPDDVLTETRSSLHHRHLPKLASEGLITYESDRGHVAPTEQLEGVRPTLSTILDADPALEAPIEP